MLCSWVSIFYCFKCFNPQIDKKFEKNVLFFRDAVYAFGSIEEYTEKIIEIFGEEKKFYSQLAQQIYVESRIIDKKFKSVQDAVKYFAFSVVFVIVMLVVWLVQLFI
jgi:hypothetical protein